MSVIVEVDRYQGHGRCYDLAPDIFESDERRHADLAEPAELPAVFEPQARVGVRNCPESALWFAPNQPPSIW